MHWQEDHQEHAPPQPVSQVVDVGFLVRCQRLPVDNAYALQQALMKALPWLAREPQAAIHTLQGATSGNGWIRSEQHGAYVELPKRARLRLRLPLHRLNEVQTLAGQTLDVAGHHVMVRHKPMTVRPLNGLPTVFAHYVVSHSGDENDFLDRVAAQLKEKNIRAPRLLSGRQYEISTPAQLMKTRSLMIDGLERADSLRLQEEGLGEWCMLGCGIFLPHKDIKAVYDIGESA